MDGSGICSYHNLSNCRIENGNSRLIPPAVSKRCPPRPCPSGYTGIIKGEALDINGQGYADMNSLTCSYHKTGTCIKGNSPVNPQNTITDCKCPEPNKDRRDVNSSLTKESCPAPYEWQTRTYPIQCHATKSIINCKYKECRPKADVKCTWVTRNLVPPANRFNSGSIKVCDRNKAEGKDGSVCGKDDACISPEVLKGNSELLGLANKDPNAKVVKIFKCDCIGSCRLKFSGLIGFQSSYANTLPDCPRSNDSTANAPCSSAGTVCKKISPESFSAGELKDGWRNIYHCGCL